MNSQELWKIEFARKLSENIWRYEMGWGEHSFSSLKSPYEREGNTILSLKALMPVFVKSKF